MWCCLSIERNRGKSDVGIKVRVYSKRVKGREGKNECGNGNGNGGGGEWIGEGALAVWALGEVEE